MVATEPAPLDLVRRIDFQRLLIGINARGDLSRVVTANLPAEVGVGRACLITHRPVLTGLEGLQ